MKTAQEIFDQLNSIDENVRIDAKKASEIDKSIMETVCAFANEPGLGGGYLLLGAVRTGFKNGLPVYVPENIENPDINNQRASSDLHDLCTKGLLEQKGQSRSTYYIAGEKFVNSRANGENHNAAGENNRGDRENNRGDRENNRGDRENNRALPEELLEKCRSLKKWESSEKMQNLIIELCTFMPLSLADIVNLTNRKPFSVRHLYLIPLIKSGKLFYTIPEMLNHPHQKYTTVKK